MIKKTLFVVFCIFATATSVMAQNISGIWRHIDDKTGASKAHIQIQKEEDGTFTGTIIKVTPMPGYKPKEICIACPMPYTNKPILGLEVLKGLKYDKNNSYSGGKILDPLTGKIYSMNAKLSAKGNRLQMRGYIGVSALGRSQTWVRSAIQ